MNLDAVHTGLALFLLANLLAGLWRVLAGPTPADRMLSTQLFGTTAVALLAMEADTRDMPALRDVALVFALLAALTAVAFVRRVWQPRGKGE